jgi:GDP-4-dehydro-6-deoxy-D-mannose reductase
MPRALVTGASGFAGPYLVEHLLREGYEVVGAVHGPHSRLPDGCTPVEIDITDREAVQGAIGEAQPDEVYHLAGLTHPASGAVNLFYQVNFGGALNLLEAVREERPEAGVLLVGSAYAYGRLDRPIVETDPFEPVNHYGVSKAAADLLGHSYALQGLRVINARPFNHSGPGQSPDFVLPTLVQQFAEIQAGTRNPIIQLGNLDSVRDLSDVRDVAQAYHRILQVGRPGEAYNVGSGRGVSVRDLFELVHQEAGVEVELAIEPSRVRATDLPYLVANTDKTHRELGWKAEITLENTVRDMLEAAEIKVRSQRFSQ